MNELRQHITTLTAIQQTLALALLAYGPVSARVLAETLGWPISKVYNTASTLKHALRPYGDLVKDAVGHSYSIRHAAVIGEDPAGIINASEPYPVRDLAPYTSTVAVVDGRAVEALGLTASAEPAEPRPEKHEARRRIYVLPWGGFVEVKFVISAFTEHGKCVIQLRNGGYIRSERRQDADEVIAALLGYVRQHDLVDVVNES